MRLETAQSYHKCVFVRGKSLKKGGYKVINEDLSKSTELNEQHKALCIPHSALIGHGDSQLLNDGIHHEYTINGMSHH